MANATVESVKKFSIRHGEKVVVGLIAALCVVFLVLAGSRESIDITPDQVANSTKAAEANINRPQKTEDIVARLDQENLVVPGFAEQVAAAETGKKPTLAFVGPPLVFPEPGAGFIRESLDLVAPTELYATASRGAIPVFERTASGELVYEEEKKEETKKTGKKKSSNRYSSMSSSSMSSMSDYGMGMGMGQPQTKETEAEKKKREATEARRLAQLFVGSASEKEKEVAEELEAKAKEGKMPKETTRGYRFVALVGTIDHQKMLDEYATKLKDPNAQPHYLRLDLQRRERVEKEWGEWVDVDREANEEVLAYVTQKDEELTAENVRLEGLVDMLPYLQVGYHRGVHVASLVPEEKRTIKPSDDASTGMSRMMGMMGSMSDMSDMSSGYDSSMADMSSAMEDMGSMSGMGGYRGGMGMDMGMGMGGPAAEADFAKTTEPTIMVRSLDFTVQPDVVYEYRVRIVVKNPNLGWDSVKAGTDNTSEELNGPWSEPTSPVYVPADITTYAMQTSPGDTEGNSVQFQVVKWNESDGITIVKPFEESPGQIVGELTSAPVPKDDGKGRTSKMIDFTSRQVVLDTSGGNRSLNTVGMAGASFDIPAMAVVMRSDGLMIIRDQARDTYNEDMRQLKEIYDQILKDADAGGKKPPETMGGYGDMSGSMMDF